jgi:hydroxyacylglutathione hydrolase
VTGNAVPVSPVVIVIPLGPVNAYIIHGKKAVLIDTGFPGSGPAILSALENNGISPRDVSLIIITHVHLDHSGSAAFLKSATDAPVLVHSSDAEELRKGMSRPPVPVTLLGRLMSLMIGKDSPSADLAVQPDISPEAPYPLDGFGVEGTIIPTPGHTGGSISVLLGSGECFVGDLVMGMIPPKRPIRPIFAEDTRAAAENLRRILSKNPKIIYPGHGGPFLPEQLQRLVG